VDAAKACAALVLVCVRWLNLRILHAGQSQTGWRM
jgi:hypothetical protein